MEKAASGEIELSIAKLVKDEIKENPHKPTREKELDLVENMTSFTYPFSEKARKLSKKLENKTSLDIVDSKIVAIAIVNNLIFWSGDRYILREKTIEEIKEVVKDTRYEFKYKKE